MMQNKIGFIPKTWEVQPDYYKQIFRSWVAVFIIDDGTTLGEEYHLELETQGYWHPEKANCARLLKQYPDCRRYINPEKFKSIKQAYQQLLKTIKTKQP